MVRHLCRPVAMVLLIIASLWLPGVARGQSPLEITLKNGTEREVETRAQLLRLLELYDLSPWLFTRKIEIDGTSTPHSHPVLTLHNRHLADDQRLLTTFLHEQIHRSLVDWEERRPARDAAIEELKKMFPVVPHGRPYGGRDVHSTYLHLIVCYLEREALASYLGKRQARRVLAEQTHYVWIYATILSDVSEEVGEVVRKHRLDQYPALSD